MADNDIIDFYKKADNDSKPEEPLKEQVETPEPVVSESVAVPVPESNDPFDKFLFNLAEKLKTEKKITEQQQQQFNERVVKPTTNPEDPFAKFLESFAGLVKEDENINKEENIKEATIDFINKLKNDDFFDRDVPKVIPKVKQAKSKSKKYLPPKFAKKVEKVEEEQPVIEQSTEPETEVKQPEQTNNPYLKELQTADKKKNKIEDKISGLSDIKKIIAQQVQEQLSRYPNIGFTGGGGGTNAVQFAEGGTMRGDLNVTGKYLSGGVDISTLFGSGGGAVSGIPDRLIAGSETLRLYSNGTIDFPNDTIRPPDETILTLESENPLLSSYTRVALSPYAFFAYDNEGNSITFDEVDNAIVLTSKDQYEWTFNQQGVLAGPNGYLTVNALSSLGRILSGGKDLLEIFALSGTGGGGGGTGREDVNTIVISNSANWNTAYNVATAYQSVSSSFVTASYLNSNFLPLSGGTLTGNTYVSSSNTEPIELFQAAISAVQIYTNTQGSPILLRDTNLSNGQPSFSLPTYPGESWGLSWDGTQWSLGYNPVGSIATLSSLDLTQGSWVVNIGNLLGVTDVSTQEVLYGTSKYITKFLGDSLYINRNGDTVTGNYVINGTVNVNSDFTADTIYIEPNTAVANDGLLTFKDTSGNNKWQIKSTDGSGFSIIDLQDNPAPNQFLLAGNGSLQLTWYDAAHTNNIFFDPTQGKISITYLDNPNGNSDQWNEAYNTATIYQSNSSSYATIAYTESTYLPLSGGTVTGDLSVSGNAFVNNNLTVFGNITALGTTTFQNTVFTTASTLSVINTGPGPALYVFQSAGPYDVASFYDGDGIEVLHVGNAGPGGFGKVGVNESFPNQELTVKGSISATDTIYANSYLSAGVNLLDIFTGGGGGGGGVTTTKKFDFVTVSNIDYSYSGTAVQGTLETSPTWKLIRLTYANNGTISNSASAIDSWTDRLTAPYV